MDRCYIFAIKVFRGLADPSRLAVLLKLRTGEKTVSMISDETGFSINKVSNHMACFKECGLVLNVQDLRYGYYRIADEKILDFLSVADEVIANNTERIIECVNYCDTNKMGQALLRRLLREVSPNQPKSI